MSSSDLSLRVESEFPRFRDCDCTSESSSSRSRKPKKQRLTRLTTHDINEVACYRAIAELKSINPGIIAINEIHINEFLTDRNTRFKTLIKNYNDDDINENCIKLINNGDNGDNLKINFEKENIIIDKYIGSGCYGLVFINKDRTARYAIKFIKHSSTYLDEINIMKRISILNSSLQQPIPNFIYTAYYHINCNKIEFEDNAGIVSKLNKCLSFNFDSTSTNEKYSMAIIEHLDGTINDILRDIMLICSRNNAEIFKSIFTQAILSLYIFHNKFEYLHNDTHVNNFFYKKIIKDDRYFYYNIGQQNFYVKNVGYLVVLADYGLASNITSDINTRIMEYKHIISYIHSLCINNYRAYYTIEQKKIIQNAMTFINEAVRFSQNKTELDFINDLLNFYNIEKTMIETNIINLIPYTI